MCADVFVGSAVVAGCAIETHLRAKSADTNNMSHSTTTQARALIAHSTHGAQKFGAIVLLVALNACVHARVERTGRQSLGGGRDGAVQILASTPVGFEEVANVTVTAEGLATPQRLQKHLVRKASLLGCHAVVNVSFPTQDTASGACIKRNEPDFSIPETFVVTRAPESLRAKAQAAGDVGLALLDVLDQSETRQGSARAWPLRWYLSTYPNSPFAGDVAALFVPVSKTLAKATPVSVRAQPLLR